MVDRSGTIEPKLYFFDGSIFKADMSTELAVRCILKVSGVKIDAESNIDRYWTPSDAGTTSVKRINDRPAPAIPVAGGPNTISPELTSKLNAVRKRKLDEHRQAGIKRRVAEIKSKFESWKKGKLLDSKIKGDSPGELSEDHMWIEEIAAKRSKIANFQVDNVSAFVLEETLEIPSYVMRFLYCCTILPDGTRKIWIIDPKIFEGSLNSKIAALLMDIAKSNKALSDSLVQTRPSFMNELRDVSIALLGQEPDRLKHVKEIACIDIYPCGGHSIIEWATTKAPDNIFDPPGWDLRAVIRQLLIDEKKGCDGIDAVCMV
jgi:hypothetical protein